MGCCWCTEACLLAHPFSRWWWSVQCAPGTIAGMEQSRHHPGPLGAPILLEEENEHGNRESCLLLLSAVEETIRRGRTGVLV